MKKLFTLLFCGFAFVAANAQQADYEIVSFCDDQGTAITSINLGPNDDLNPRFILKNNGPDIIALADTMWIDVTFAGQTMPLMYLTGDLLQPLTAGLQSPVGSSGDPLLTAAEMTQYQLTGTFNLCYAVRIAGTTVDPVPANNQKCIDITRGGVGIDGFNAEEINVYPNPATSVINVANAENAQVAVFDINGKLMVSVENASANQTIDASDFANGLYFVRITDGNNVVTKKINVVK